MILITGITGRVGGAAATMLLESGEPLRALVRNTDKAAQFADAGAVAATILRDGGYANQTCTLTGSELPPTVGRILGRPPTTLEDFFRDHIGVFRNTEPAGP